VRDPTEAGTNEGMRDYFSSSWVALTDSELLESVAHDAGTELPHVGVRTCQFGKFTKHKTSLGIRDPDKVRSRSPVVARAEPRLKVRGLQ
jgi:hypothetical protein